MRPLRDQAKRPTAMHLAEDKSNAIISDFNYFPLLCNRLHGWKTGRGGRCTPAFYYYIIHIRMEISLSFSTLQTQLSFISLITALHNLFPMGRRRTTCTVTWGRHRGLNPFSCQFLSSKQKPYFSLSHIFPTHSDTLLWIMSRDGGGQKAQESFFGGGGSLF